MLVEGDGLLGRPGGLGPRQFGDFELAFGRLGIGRRGGMRLQRFRPVALEEFAQAVAHDLGRVFAGHRQHVLAGQARVDARAAQHRVQVLLDVVRLAFFQQQYGALAAAEVDDLVLDDGVGHVHDVQRDAAVAEVVRQAQQLQGADDAVVQTALQDQADVVLVAVEVLVERVFLDVADGGGPAFLDLLLFMQEGGGRQHDAAGVARRAFQRLGQRIGGALVFLCDEAAVHMAAANAQLQHHGCLAGFGQFEAVFHRLDHAFQVGARVQQPDLRFHGERMRAFLHDGRAFAVVFAHDHQRAARDAA
ncbi:hypothetical protein D3C72_460300 [compost metagenome]